MYEQKGTHCALSPLHTLTAPLYVSKGKSCALRDIDVLSMYKREYFQGYPMVILLHPTTYVNCMVSLLSSAVQFTVYCLDSLDTILSVVIVV